LLFLTGLLLVLYGLIGGGVLWSDAQWTPKLALDLEGGTEIVLTPVSTTGGDTKISENTLNQAIGIIRQRINGNGVSEAEVTTQGSKNIVVSLPGKPDQATIDLVKQSAQLRFRAVIEAEPMTPTPTPTPTSTSEDGGVIPTAEPDTATMSVEPSETVNPRGVPGALRAETPTAPATTEDSPAAETSATPTVQATDASDLAWATEVAPGTNGATYQDLFEALDCSDPANLAGGGGEDPALPLVTCDTDGTEKYLLGPAEVVGTDVASASASQETNSQGAVTGAGWQVNLEFTGTGADKFADVTTRLVALDGNQNRFAIVLDGLVISAPSTNEAILGGSAQITGDFTQPEAQTLANQLKFGALPISFQVETENQISATLGGEQLQRGLLAGLIGLILVVLYSLLQYRALGMVTIASLTIAGAFTYGLVVLLGWRQGYRLSLAGVAGLIVSIGITADSFIVYFERIRDEVRDGRALAHAVEAAWGRARRTILASDTVSFLAAVVLYVLAVGGVRGFAFTLGLTTLVDVLVVFLFTKPMVTLLSRTKFFGGGHKLSGFDPEHLGRTVVYAGRGRIRGGPTIAERRAGRSTGSSTGAETDPGGQSGAEDPPPDKDGTESVHMSGDTDSSGEGE
jgi:preprotein translocase subunit SecD